MNYIVYGKKIGDRCYGAINLHEGKVGVGLVYATLIPDCDRAKMYADKLAEMVPGFYLPSSRRRHSQGLL